MLVTAVTFAVLRAAPAFQREDDFRIVVVLGVAIAGVVSTIAILPAAVMLLWPRPFARGLALTGVYTLTLVGIHWFIVGIVRWYGGPLGPYQIHAGLSAIMLSYCGTCCLAAYVARQGGYRLARHDGRRAA
jgi:hypothetical protein